MSNIGPMAAEEECVKHALLSLAGAYVLDYLPSPQLLARTNNHYLRAAASISGALSSTPAPNRQGRQRSVSTFTTHNR
jgi:hypothetical protein